MLVRGVKELKKYFWKLIKTQQLIRQNLCTVLILERVHLNALQKWIVGRLQVGITCEQQKNGRGFRNVKKKKQKLKS